MFCAAKVVIFYKLSNFPTKICNIFYYPLKLMIVFKQKKSPVTGITGDSYF